MARLVTRSEFARIARVTPGSITRAARRRDLAEALSNGRIDVDHFAAREYLRRHGVADPQVPGTPAAAPRAPSPAAAPVIPEITPPAKSAPGRPPARVPPASPAPEPTSPAQIEAPDDLDEFRDWTLQQLLDEFGTARRFVDWLDAMRKLEDVRAKRLANLEREGKLIQREPVRTHVFGIIDATFRRLLTDAPKTTARRLYGLAKSGAPIEEAEAEVKDINSSLVKAIKATAIRVLGH